jgi:hypothetical protein
VTRSDLAIDAVLWLIATVALYLGLGWVFLAAAIGAS